MSGLHQQPLLLALVMAICLNTTQLLAGSDSSRFNYDDVLLQRVEKRYGPAAVTRLKNHAELIKQQAAGTELDKVTYVNDFFNQIDYFTDLQHWNKEDYWATPFEKLTTNGGDCEDYAIAKYFTLRELGIAEDKIRMMYVKAINWGEAHMVLIYFPTATDIPLVLDNINPNILPANKRKDLVPVYSFNGDGLWLAKSRGTGKRVGSAGRIRLWTDLQQRLNQ